MEWWGVPNRCKSSRPGGIRTPDQGIMSPLLSPLSYGPKVFDDNRLGLNAGGSTGHFVT